jgi:hypothetical protein
MSQEYAELIDCPAKTSPLDVKENDHVLDFAAHLSCFFQSW